jgi:hypothetical protein
VKKPIGIACTLQLFHMLRGAGASKDRRVKLMETHVIAPYNQPIETIEWLRWRGYRVMVSGTSGTPASSVVFGRKNEAAYVAVLGDTLVWDGEKVVIQ